MSAALEAAGISVRFGAVAALSRVNISLEPGERRALIGPNGAGKTTLFNAISGEARLVEGRVRLADQDVTELAAWRRARLGLGRTFQRSTLFTQLTVAENLAAAVRSRHRTGWRFWPGGDAGVGAEVESRLERTSLGHLANRPAGKLGHGEQRALEIELALAGEPSVLLLDEPMAGLSPAERRTAVERLRALPREVTLVIVEHDLDAVFALAERITVLDHGVVIADGPAERVRADPRVQEVYLRA